MKRFFEGFLDILAAALAVWIGVEEWWTNGAGPIPALAILLAGLYLHRLNEGGPD